MMIVVTMTKGYPAIVMIDFEPKALQARVAHWGFRTSSFACTEVESWMQEITGLHALFCYGRCKWRVCMHL